MAFYVGQKVVCVDDSPSKWGDPSLLTKGAIYTIRKVVMEGRGVWLDEVSHDRPDNIFGYEAFWAWRFRPAVEKKTDISIFTKMLTPKMEDA